MKQTLVKTMKAIQVSQPKGQWEAVEREIPEPRLGQVRIKVEACGVCHSDLFVKEGYWPGIQYPRIPGHEVVGRIDAVGEGITLWKVGQRVGVGWHGGHDFVCDACRHGDFMMCSQLKITGISFDGGYAEYMVAPEHAVAAIPDELSSEEAAPLMCAGVTVFNALRHSGAKPGDTVAIHGVGGLGHLGIQFARQMGFVTIAIGRQKDKESLAKKLGATRYIDTATSDPATELKNSGGARVILATAPDAKAISELVGGLSRNGKLLVVAAPAEPLNFSVLPLIGGRGSVAGWASGTGKDAEDALRFSALTGVRPMIERYPLAKAADAYAQMLSGKARFRAVLTVGN